MIPHLKILQTLFLITLFLGITYITLTTTPEARNERVECLSLNGYGEHPQSGAVINTGIVSFWIYRLIPYYPLLALTFWAFIFWSVRNTDSWLLLVMFAILALRTANYQHEEVYAGLPFIYLALTSRNEILKGICSGIALTVRPIYIFYHLGFVRKPVVWVAGILTAGVIYTVALFTFPEFHIYNPITNLLNGGTEINYSLWFLDYALLILIPIMWAADERIS